MLDINAICNTSLDVTSAINAAGTVTYTKSGSTSMSASRVHPNTSILSFMPEARRLAWVWCIHSIVGKEVHSVDEMVSEALTSAVREGFAKKGDYIAISAGLPFGEQGTTNLLHIATIK